MRQILVDHARERQAQKRGGGLIKVSLTRAEAEPQARDLELLALNSALEELAEMDERQARIVELRYFGGLPIEETAEVTGVSPATVKRHWNLARAWLYRRIKNE